MPIYELALTMGQYNCSYLLLLSPTPLMCMGKKGKLVRAVNKTALMQVYGIKSANPTPRI